MQHECPLNIPSRKDSEWYFAIHKVIMRQYYYQLLVQTKSCTCNLRLVCSCPLREIVLQNKILAPHCGFNLSVFYYFHRLFLILKKACFFFSCLSLHIRLKLHASLTIRTCIKNNICSSILHKFESVSKWSLIMFHFGSEVLVRYIYLPRAES